MLSAGVPLTQDFECELTVKWFGDLATGTDEAERAEGVGAAACQGRVVRARGGTQKYAPTLCAGVPLTQP